MSALIDLKNISLKFKLNYSKASGLKELVSYALRPPQWKKQLSNKTKEFWALKDVSFTLHEGDRLGIIGHNGAGKSSLLKVISRIYRPTSGQVKVIGRVASLLEIGAGFHPELTGLENIFLNASILGIPRKTIKTKLDSIIEFSELHDFIQVPVKYYSTGMYLRLAFTVATEVPPDILILDELYAGGDAAFIQKANKRLEEFVKKSKILILVAHQLDYIERFSNKVLIMDQGKVTEVGAPSVVIQKYLKAMQGSK